MIALTMSLKSSLIVPFQSRFSFMSPQFPCCFIFILNINHLQENTRYTFRNQGNEKRHNSDEGVLSVKHPYGTTFKFSAYLTSMEWTTSVDSCLISSIASKYWVCTFSFLINVSQTNVSVLLLIVCPVIQRWSNRSVIGSQVRKSVMSITSSIDADLLSA